MTEYEQWRRRHPQAALELEQLTAPHITEHRVGGSEAGAQQRARLAVAEQGAKSWRNNVGATPSKCPACREKQMPVRYGLANDSTKMNKKIKSSDLILAIPRVVTPDMVGTTIAQFGSLECKRPGWKFNPNDEREAAQAAWLNLINELGGFARFTTGEVQL